jgi:hypothetical protein
MSWRLLLSLLSLASVILVSASCGKKTPTLNLLVWEGMPTQHS